MPFPPRYRTAWTATGRGFNVHGSKPVYHYIDWCLCFAPGLITQIRAAGLDECMPWWVYDHDGRLHTSFGFRLLCRVNLAHGVLCCSLKSHSDGVGYVAGFALAVPIVTGRGENFGV